MEHSSTSSAVWPRISLTSNPSRNTPKMSCEAGKTKALDYLDRAEAGTDFDFFFELISTGKATSKIRVPKTPKMVTPIVVRFQFAVALLFYFVLYDKGMLF